VAVGDVMSDPEFNVGFDVMEPDFNLETHYKVTMLTREEWTRGPGTPPIVSVLGWFTDGSKTMEGTKARVCEHLLGRRLSISVGKHATVFRLWYMPSWPVFMKFK
jgi:hypothetical protein